MADLSNCPQIHASLSFNLVSNRLTVSPMYIFPQVHGNHIGQFSHGELVTLREKLTRVKDKLPMGKLSNVVYQVPCTCGKIYIGETVWRLDTRLKKHKDACICGQLDKSAIAEHAWSEYHPILWESTKVIDRANRQDILRLKEALHIRLTNKDERFNRDVGMVVPDCWVATINHPPSTHVRMPAHAH